MGANAFIWLTPEQGVFVRHVVEAVGLSIVGAGSPVKGQSGAVAAELKTEAADDLHAAMRKIDADLIWIASPGSFGTGGGEDDAAALLAAHGRGVKVATLEPIPASAMDLAGGGWGGWGPSGGSGSPTDAIRFCPLTRFSSPFREATEVLESFGRISAVAIEAWSTTAEGSLGAKLFSALDLIGALMGEPEMIDAAYVASVQAGALRPLPAETLRDLHGTIIATLRFADGRAASLVAGDQGGRWNRTATLIGPAGRLRVFDDGFEWIDAQGQKVDASRPADAKRGQAPSSPHSVKAMVDSLTRLLDPNLPDDGPADLASILSMGQTTLLSARTGQSESLATVRRMVGATA